MSISGDAAGQIVRASVSGVRIAAKVSGSAARRLASLIYTVLRDTKKTKGKIRLGNMMKSGGDLKVFAVKDAELRDFCKTAKKYGVVYCVLKDTVANDGVTDILVKSNDAGKVNRILQRYGFSIVEGGEITPVAETDSQSKPGEEMPAQELARTMNERVQTYVKGIVNDKPNPTAEQAQNGNPTMARTMTSDPFEPFLKVTGPRLNGEELRSLKPDGEERPSVRKELEKIKEELKEKYNEARGKNMEVPSAYLESRKKADKEDFSIDK